MTCDKNFFFFFFAKKKKKDCVKDEFLLVVKLRFRV